ncbi:MAG: membrane protein insertion efficiency factor YidD [Rhodopila sp.]|nr:membrane protein insertion efficiency factor YidD [Rhodopila sp.]
MNTRWLWRKPVDAIVLAVATMGTSITLVITIMLMKFAPRRTYREDRSRWFTEQNIPPPELRPHGDRIIRAAIFLYKRSWIRKRLHRSTVSRCRFIPSCSEYAILAVRKYGLLRGLVMIGGRFRRCNPAYRGDYVDFP